MSIYKFAELSSCVRGERFKITFDGDCKQYAALLTEGEFEMYKKDLNSVKRKYVSFPVVLISESNDDRLIVVIDLDGKDMPTEWNGSVKRYSPLIPVAKIDELPYIFKRRVKNATGTDADESMIQYWEDNKSNEATIDLAKKNVVCPSCGKPVSPDELDGAHVVLANGSSTTQYITPTCRTCNRSKVDRIFEVNSVDLVKAP